MKTLRWTSHDLELLPDNERYDIVDGELYVSKQPHWQHQYTCELAATTSGDLSTPRRCASTG